MTAVEIYFRQGDLVQYDGKDASSCVIKATAVNCAVLHEVKGWFLYATTQIGTDVFGSNLRIITEKRKDPRH